MKKTTVIVTVGVIAALIWASRPDNPSTPVATSPEAVSARPAGGVSGSLRNARAARRGHDTTQAGPETSATVSQEPEAPVAEEAAGAAADPAKTFWAFASEQAPATQDPGVTLDEFDRPYTMTMTEAGFAQLSPADKSTAITEIADSLRQARRDALDTYAQADDDIAQGRYGQAEDALVSEVERLSDFNANEEGLYLTRIMGVSFQQTALKKLQTLYTRTGNQFKLESTQQHWQALEAQKRQMQAAQMEQAG